MPVIISLSPWSSFWTMGREGGTSSDFLAVEALKKINPQVLHFVEDGSPCDDGNITIPVHLENRHNLLSRILKRLGLIGHRYVFEVTEKKWQKYNDDFLTQVIAELEKRNVGSVDLVYCHTALLVECGRKLGMIFKCPAVSHFYGTFLAPCIGNQDAYLMYPTEYLGWITPVDLRICLDDGTRGLEVAKDLSLPLDKFLFQLHGLDTNELNSEIQIDVSEFLKPDTLHVMTASRLAVWKHLDRLLKAIPDVIKNVKNVQFLILGDGPERQKLENLSRDLKITEYVRFVSSVSRKTVFALMQKCDVFVSTNDVSNLSQGLKEAMYFGMCVVTLDTGDTHQLIKDGVTGRLLCPDDTSVLSKALTEVLTQPDTRIRLRQSAKDFIEKHEPTLDTVMTDRVSVLKSLIDSYKAEKIRILI